MTGLDLETFLQLLRADLGAWASLGLVVVVLALMTWTSWGSRRALRKCLVLSIAAHVGLVLYGSTFPIVMAVLGDRADDSADVVPIRVQLASNGDGSSPEGADVKGPDGRPARAVAAWDRAADAAGLADPSIRPIPKGSDRANLPNVPQPRRELLPPTAVVLEINPPAPTVPANSTLVPTPIAAASVAPAAAAETETPPPTTAPPTVDSAPGGD